MKNQNVGKRGKMQKKINAIVARINRRRGEERHQKIGSVLCNRHCKMHCILHCILTSILHTECFAAACTTYCLSLVWTFKRGECFGQTSNAFKLRYNNHTESLRNEKKDMPGASICGTILILLMIALFHER